MVPLAYVNRLVQWARRGAVFGGVVACKPSTPTLEDAWRLAEARHHEDSFYCSTSLRLSHEGDSVEGNDCLGALIRANFMRGVCRDEPHGSKDFPAVHVCPMTFFPMPSRGTEKDGRISIVCGEPDVRVTRVVDDGNGAKIEYVLGARIREDAQREFAACSLKSTTVESRHELRVRRDARGSWVPADSSGAESGGADAPTAAPSHSAPAVNAEPVPAFVGTPSASSVAVRGVWTTGMVFYTFDMLPEFRACDRPGNFRLKLEGSKLDGLTEFGSQPFTGAMGYVEGHATWLLFKKPQRIRGDLSGIQFAGEVTFHDVSVVREARNRCRPEPAVVGAVAP